MHIPENYLSPQTCGVLDVAMVGIWAVAIKKVGEQVPREKMPLLGVAAAFCFIAMMFNIPLPGGTTGHAVCATLVAILFGPWPACIAVSIALIIQAVFFGDGGILAIGANCFNMAFVMPWVGYGLYTFIKSKIRGLHGELIAAGISSYVAINCAALLAAIEFGIQPLLFTDAADNALYCPYPIWISVPAMLAGHLTIFGLAEVVFTVGILAFVRKVVPDFCVNNAKADSGNKGLIPIGILLGALVLATPLGLLAEGTAWGEWDSADLADLVGYTPIGLESGFSWESMMPDYSFGALPEPVGYVMSALIGIALLIIIFKLASLTMRKSVDFD